MSMLWNNIIHNFTILLTNTFSNTLLWIYKSVNLNIFSDLRKPDLVPGESLSPSIKIDTVKEKYSAYNMTNRMRSFHMQLATEYGRENVKIFRQWEKYKRKMAGLCQP